MSVLEAVILLDTTAPLALSLVAIVKVPSVKVAPHFADSKVGPSPADTSVKLETEYMGLTTPEFAAFHTAEVANVWMLTL